MTKKTTWSFDIRPTSQHYQRLAEQLRLAEHTQVHPALWQRRETVADRLRAMADDPQREQNVATYHALRLLLW